MDSFEFVCARIPLLMTNCKLASDGMSVIGSVIGEGDAFLRRGQLRAWISNNTDLRKFLDTSVSSISGHIAGASYRAGEAGAQATAQSERTKPVLVANRFHAISQASMMSAKLRNTELASQWLRR